MVSCPSCGGPIRAKDLDRFSLKPYQTCPHCGTRFTVDPGTRRRQQVALVLSLGALASTAGWLLLDRPWLVPSVTSYAILIGFIAWANRRVRFVEYD